MRHLVLVGAHGHGGHVDVAVCHGHAAKILLRGFLTRGGELGHGAGRRRLRRLSAGVGVNLGVEDEDVDVPVLGEDVVETAVADVIGPAVPADAPDALFDEVVLKLGDLRDERLGRRARCPEGFRQGRLDGLDRGSRFAVHRFPEALHLA